MNTENLSVFKIHKLSQAQYERESDAGRIEPNALYLTPDEKITAEQIGAAPSGYGLGEQEAKYIYSGDKLSNHRASGWYRYTVDVEDNPVVGYGGNMLVIASDLQVVQFAYPAVESNSPRLGCVLQRVIIHNVVIGEWEWVNPPVMLGVEYRTTERWNGKAVYKMLVDFGSLPDGTVYGKSVRLATIVDELVDMSGVVTLDNMSRSLESIQGKSWLCSNMEDETGKYTVIDCSGSEKQDLSAFSAKIILKYTKA